MMSRERTVVLATILALCLGAGCSGPAASGPSGGVVASSDSTPSWVHGGSGRRTEGDARVFYGVGVVDGVQNEALARQTAANRARAEIAKIFDTYIAAMMRDYQRSTTAGDFQNSSEEQDVVSAQKTITETTLRGVEIRDYWMNPNSGALYALAVLDLNTMKSLLDGAQGLNPTVRDHVRKNADKAFSDLDAELSKRDERKEPAAEPPAEPPPAEPAPATEPEPAEEPEPEAAPAQPADKVRVGLKISGNKAAIIQTCFAGQLTERGFELYEGTSDVDVLVQGTLKYAKAGIIRGSHMVNAWVELRLIDVQNGRTIVALDKKLKVGRPRLNQSVQTAISQLCTKVTPEMVSKINAYLKR